MKAAVLLLVVLLTGCAPAPRVSPACAEVAAARAAVGELQTIFSGAQGRLTDRAYLAAAATQGQQVLDRYGARAGASETQTLRTTVAGALAAGVAVLRAFAQGAPGETEAALYGQLLRAATTEVSRLRTAERCP